MFTKLVIVLVVLFALSLLFETGIVLYLVCAIASWWFVKWLLKFKFPFWLLVVIFVAFPVTAWAIVHILAQLLGNISSVLG